MNLPFQLTVHMFTCNLNILFLPCLLLQLLLLTIIMEALTTSWVLCWLTGMGAVLVIVVIVGAEGNINVDMSTRPRIDLPETKYIQNLDYLCLNICICTFIG